MATTTAFTGIKLKKPPYLTNICFHHYPTHTIKLTHFSHPGLLSLLFIAEIYHKQGFGILKDNLKAYLNYMN